MTMFQVKVHGKWRDTAIPGCANIKEVGNLVMTMGKKPLAFELRFFSDLVRDIWGTAAFRDNNGQPIEMLTTEPHHQNTLLKLDHMFVVSYQLDVLRLQLFYEYKELGSKQTKSGKSVNSWYRKDGCVEVSIMEA